MNAPRSQKPGYEVKDIHFGALVMLTGLLFILLGATLLISRGLDRVLIRLLSSREQPSSPLAQLHRLPPEPRLQIDPAVDLIRLRDVENVTLTNYAWIDPAAGKVRIPIARAMEILAERGLPARKSTQ